MIRAVLIMLAMAISYIWACNYQGDERRQIILTMWFVYPFLSLWCCKLLYDWRMK